MSKPYQGDWVLRSVLFVPGHSETMVKKGADTEADCIVLDLEDAVPAGLKAKARETVRHALEKGVYSRKAVFVRVNSFETNLTNEDLAGVACVNLNGIVYPRANCAEDIERLDSKLACRERELGLTAGHLSLIPVLETVRAVLNARAVTKASQRLVGLIFGCEDFLADLQGRHSDDDIALVVPRAQVALAARAAGIEPVDTPYVQVKDLEGLRRFAARGRDLGMGGMCAMNPAQVSVINDMYTPTDEEIRSGREVIEAAESPDSAERGVFIAGGKFISPPTVKAAQKTLACHEAIRNLEEFYRKS